MAGRHPVRQKRNSINWWLSLPDVFTKYRRQSVCGSTTTSSTLISPPFPGNYALNLRQLYLLNTNYADLSFLFTILPGEKTNAHLGTEYLAALETEQQHALLS